MMTLFFSMVADTSIDEVTYRTITYDLYNMVTCNNQLFCWFKSYWYIHY